MNDPTTLQIIWFLLITILWSGYFVLEGFDFGVGMLLRRLGKTEKERRDLLHTFGPVWDGNEVWLLTAGGATFAAFPHWYATLFSGFYLALFLILVGLIIRNVGIELWGKRDDAAWKARWELAIIVGSVIPALLWGVAWANIVKGVAIDGSFEFVGTFWDLLNPYALLGGLVTLTLFLAHGTLFLQLRTQGVLLERAQAHAKVFTSAAAVTTAAFVIWTLARQSGNGGIEVVSLYLFLLSLGALAGTLVLRATKPGFAFSASALGIVLMFAGLWAELFPNAMVSSLGADNDISLAEAASTPYTLKVMTIVAVIMVPIVLLYQGWTYWVFRHRVGGPDAVKGDSPLDLLGDKRPEPPSQPAGA
jgi:cytochrome d ubiquinol oxidase subunit II